jgi:hypothetical protein
MDGWMDGWMVGFNSWRGYEIFLYTTAFRLALRPTQPPSKLVLGPASLGVKQLGHEADHSSPPTTKSKNGGAIPPLHMFLWQSTLSTGTTLPYL